ncbi:hypothetical protein GH975_00370 [Litorivicinus lipolyticus]|uniref:O-antigen ligase-related domain-containing protein n=1 Tax=Litorivicinus lipolyticus TaxID=418701 RepID=A0A5Q2Q580_9GAMM|nr:O-antigen ligase family protein [Litorivicinus lipolyticus]QGG79089.1 hypothetical protein GH975_00370 [Litorivicinus lipolyticus]
MSRRLLCWISAVGVFFSLSLALAFPSGYSVGPVILLIGSLLTVVLLGQGHMRDVPAGLWASAGLFLLAALVSDVVPSGSFREADGPSRFMLAAMSMVVIFVGRPSQQFIWVGAVSGAMTMFVLALIERSTGVGRVGLGNNPIQTGGIATFTAIACLGTMVFYLQNFTGRVRVLGVSFGLLGVLMGLTVSGMTGSRGSWLGFAFGIGGFMYALYVGRLLTRRTTFLLLMAVVVAMSFVVVTSDRVEVGVTEFFAYFDGTKATSVGYRLELWWASVFQFAEAPIIGVGQNGYMESKAILVRDAGFNPGIAQFGHAHNHFMDTLAKRGLLGILALISSLVVIVFYGRRAFFEGNREEVALYGALIGLVFALIGCMLTQGFLAHNSGSTVFYFWTLAVLALLTIHANKPPAHPPAAS